MPEGGMVNFGIDTLFELDHYRKILKGKRLALVCHPASVTKDLEHSLSALTKAGFQVVCAFGPQHGIRGEKQDNMMESHDYFDDHFQIPVYSLYGASRRPSDESLHNVDIVLFDLQDLGTRVYTFLTTLLYMMEACKRLAIPLWILDRPNPAGRPVEGLRLEPGWESFVGASNLIMRHGLTLGEASVWFLRHFQMDLDLQVVSGEFRRRDWPTSRSWVNPSPNAPNPYMARCFPGTVMLEGTTLSEGRGTTRPLEMFGAPDLDAQILKKKMLELAPEWLEGCILRPCYFEPTFHKHKGLLCQGFQLHVDDEHYDAHRFRPYRIVALFFKAIRLLSPDYVLWRDFPYEYERDRLAIDVINGGPQLRQWVDDKSARPGDLEGVLLQDEKSWIEEISSIIQLQVGKTGALEGI